MAMRTRGDLCGFTLANETAYGTTGTTKTFGGVLSSLETPGDETLEYDQGCGTRQWENIVRTMEAYSWKADFTMPSGTPANWTQWFTYAQGSLTAVSNDLASFSAGFRISSAEYMTSVGCKVNSLSLSADAVGSPIKFSVDAMAKKNTFGTSAVIVAVTRPAAAPITYASLWTRNGTAIPVKSWTLTLNNGLVGDPGLDADGTGLAAGNGSIPGGSTDITLDLTITSVDSTYDILKQTGTSSDELVLTMDGYTITCSDCFMKTDYPTRAQNPYDETISYIVKSLVVAVDE